MVKTVNKSIVQKHLIRTIYGDRESAREVIYIPFSVCKCLINKHTKAIKM